MKINEHTFNHRRRENIVEACTALPFSRNITYIYIHTCRRLLTIVGEHASLKRYHSQLDISLFQRLLNIDSGETYKRHEKILNAKFISKTHFNSKVCKIVRRFSKDNYISPINYSFSN